MEEVNISGVALTDGLNQNKAVCKFITEDGVEYSKFHNNRIIIIHGLSIYKV